MKKLFTIAISLFVSTIAFAELPHTFKNGEILTADMLNKNLQYLEGNEYSQYHTVRANGKIIGRGSLDYSMQYMDIIVRNDYKPIRINNKGEDTGTHLYFAAEDCTGHPYVGATPYDEDNEIEKYFTLPLAKGMLFAYVTPEFNKLYYYPPKAQLYKPTVRSYWNAGNQTCVKEVKNNKIMIQGLPNDPAVTGVETYPFPAPITMDGFTSSLIVK